MSAYLDTLLTPAVTAAQTRYYGRAMATTGAPVGDRLGDDERAFIAERDSFYLATVTETGWPYVQHRGGPAGFLRVIGPTELAFADFRGNRQLVSTGNVTAGDRVALFLMDYPRRTRLKILGHARVLDARENPELAAQLADPGTRQIVERLFLIDVVGFDWNCPKFITPRYTLAEVEELAAPLRRRIAALEEQLKAKNKTEN
jgi:predicted pyridoxine 5'-phosphate oxidase superfamily flavin-nucleotide-binding protein